MLAVAFVLVALGGCASERAAENPTAMTTVGPDQCEDGCPSVSLADPPTIIRKGAVATFRGRVEDSSANFLYRISVTRGDVANTEEIAGTFRSRKRVVYPTRRWRAARPGRYRVCLVGVRAAFPHGLNSECRTFSVG